MVNNDENDDLKSFCLETSKNLKKARVDYDNAVADYQNRERRLSELRTQQAELKKQIETLKADRATQLADLKTTRATQLADGNSNGVVETDKAIESTKEIDNAISKAEREVEDIIAATGVLESRLYDSADNLRHAHATLENAIKQSAAARYRLCLVAIKEKEVLISTAIGLKQASWGYGGSATAKDVIEDAGFSSIKAKKIPSDLGNPSQWLINSLPERPKPQLSEKEVLSIQEARELALRQKAIEDREFSKKAWEAFVKADELRFGKRHESVGMAVRSYDYAAAN